MLRCRRQIRRNIIDVMETASSLDADQYLSDGSTSLIVHHPATLQQQAAVIREESISMCKSLSTQLQLHGRL
jgi:hypothetical protein